MNNLQLLTNAQKILTQTAENKSVKNAWESGFLIIGLAHIDWEGAAEIFRDYFSLQQPNGFLPFAREEDTSNIAPPIWGFLLHKLYNQADSQDKASLFIKEMFPKVVHFHEYLYTHRDQEEDGLCYIQHPLESIFEDNYPSSAEGQYLPVQDPFFNTLLTLSNEALIRVAEILKEDVSDLVQWYELTVHTFNEKLWDEEYGIYNAWNLTTNEVIPVENISGILPLLGGIPDIEQALKMLDLIDNSAFAGTSENPAFICPLYSLESGELEANSPYFASISLDYNWLLYQGLQQYETPEFMETAALLKKDCLELLSKNGFYKQFNCYKKNSANAGIGAKENPIAAAILLDWLL